MLKDVVESALIVVTQLGMPVVILFLIGYLSYESDRHPLPLKRRRFGTPASGPDDSRGGGDGSLRQPCWKMKQCSAEKRRDCPTQRWPDLPCWQAVRQSLGRLQAECLDCDRFLAPPARGLG